MARWTIELRTENPGDLAMTQVCSWWPNTQYLVYTFSDRLGLANAGDSVVYLAHILEGRLGRHQQDSFITVVRECNRDGSFKAERPIFETEHATVQEALRAHRDVVEALERGRRHLKELESHRLAG